MATSKCNICGSARVVKMIQPSRGALKAVALPICRRCDRRQCERCEAYIQDVFARRCSCGHRLIGANN